MILRQDELVRMMKGGSVTHDDVTVCLSKDAMDFCKFLQRCTIAFILGVLVVVGLCTLWGMLWSTT